MQTKIGNVFGIRIINKYLKLKLEIIKNKRQIVKIAIIKPKRISSVILSLNLSLENLYKLNKESIEKLINYLKEKDLSRYASLIQRLGLRR